MKATSKGEPKSRGGTCGDHRARRTKGLRTVQMSLQCENSQPQGETQNLRLKLELLPASHKEQGTGSEKMLRGGRTLLRDGEATSPRVCLHECVCVCDFKNHTRQIRHLENMVQTWAGEWRPSLLPPQEDLPGGVRRAGRAWCLQGESAILQEGKWWK